MPELTQSSGAEIVDVDVTEEVAPFPEKKSPPKKKPKAELNGAEVVVRGSDNFTEPEEDWPHQWLEFQGDRLAVRKPTQQALAGFSLAMSRYVSNQTRNDITGLFIARHMSPETFARVFSRLMDGDDPDYNDETVSALIRQIVELSTDPSEAKTEG